MKRIIVIAAFLVAGCAPLNFGNQNLSMQLVQDSIAPGKSTKADVIAAFGEPANITVYATGQALPKPGVKEQLAYIRMTREGFATMSMTTLAVFLDEKGIVLDYAMSEQKPPQRQSGQPMTVSAEGR
jgi:hypothetical protein